MTPIDQELLDIALAALSKNKVRVDTLETKAISLKDTIDSNKQNYKNDREFLDKKLETMTDGFKSELEDVLKAIPVPEDGKNGVDGKDGLSITGEKGDQGEQGLAGKDGKDGVNGSNGRDGRDGIDGLDGKSIPGSKGRDGSDGVGITDIKATHSKLLIELTDGSVKDFKLPKPKTVPAGVTAMPTEIVVMRNIHDVSVDNAVDGDLLTKENGKWIAKTPEVVAGSAGAITDRAEIEGMFKVAETTAYKELTYTGADITAIDIYTDNGKLTKLFSKIIGYNTGNITSVSITDEVNGGTLVKTIAYLDGNITSITSAYTS